MPEIQSAVGKQPALNAVRDQEVVQNLLNQISADKGGPVTPLVEPFRPNFVSRSLQEAIIRFQNQNVDPPKRDGRVDRIGQTIRKLNELANGSDPTPTVAKKRTTFHSKPLAPPGQKLFIAPELHPHIVLNAVVEEDLNKEADAFRQRIREQLRGNPNAQAVEAFLNSRTKSSITGLPILDNTFVFGIARVNFDVVERNHNGTPIGNIGSRVSTAESNNSHPVILFSNTGGASVLGPATLIVVFGNSPKADQRVSGATLLLNNGELKKFIGQMSNKDNGVTDIPLQ